MQQLKMYSHVRIKILIDISIDRNGWGFNQCEPKIDDIGCLIDVLTANNLPDRYVVEMSQNETGDTIWLSEFLREELESVE